MNELIKALREAAEQHPLDAPMELFSEAADKIELLQSVEEIFNNAPEADHCLTSEELNKIKAEAVREAVKNCIYADDVMCEELEQYANKLESEQ